MNRKPNKDTDFSKARNFDWDFYLGGVPQEVICLTDYEHQPDNNLYCYPLGETPTYDNVIPFDKRWGAVDWSYLIKPSNSIKHKWDDIRTSASWKGIIYRNAKEFHTINAHSKTYVLAKVELAIIEFGEHPIAFHFRDYDKKTIGRKIWYYNSPCVVDRIDGATFYIRGEDGKIACPYSWKRGKHSDMCNEEAWKEEYADGLMIDYDNPHVDWFRG